MAGPIRIQVETDARRAAGELDNLSNKSGRLSGTLKTLAKGALLGLGAGLVAAAAGAAKLAQGAIEDEQAASRMAQTFKKAAGATNAQVAATEDWITAQGKALGVADDDLRPALGRLVAATKDVDKAQRLASLAMDVSAGTGKSLEQVSTALAKAQNGQTAGLSRLGISTKNASGDVIGMEEATRRLADTFGGAAQKNADTLGGRIDRLKLMASEAGETLGSKMLPYIERFATFLTDKAIPAAQRIAGELSDRFGPTISAISGFLTGQLIPAIRDLVEKWLAGAKGAFDNIKAAMDRNSDTIAELKDWFSALWGFIRDSLLPLLGRFYQTVLPAIGDAIGILIDGVKVLMEVFRFLWNNVLQPIIKLMLNGFASVLDGWGALLRALGKVPGFEWAKEAGDKMSAAAQQARNLADDINKIPPRKEVTVNVTYTYSGLRGPGGQGPTRGRDDEYAPRAPASTMTPPTPKIIISADERHQLDRGRDIARDLSAYYAAGGT